MIKRIGPLLLLFVLLSSTYSVTTPVFEAPDEVWHYAYVRYLAENYGLPALTDDASGAYQEVAQPPLYYAVAALISGWVPDEDLAKLMWHNPNFGYQAGVTVNDNKNMLIHTARERFPWRGAVLAIHLARLASLAFGLLTLTATWGLGRETFPKQPIWALCVAAVVAFSPQFIFISSVVNNDSAAAALSTATLWATARAINRGLTSRRSLSLGLLMGLAILTKTSALLLLPLTVVALTYTHRSLDRKTLIHHLSSIILVTSAVGGWWYVRNALLYHDPLAIYAHVDTPWGRAAPAPLLTLLSELPTVYKSFWGAFGWGHIQFPLWVYLLLGIPAAASLVGWAKALTNRQLPGSSRVLLLAIAWWSLVFVALLQWMRRVQAPHGRLLFPAVGAGALLLVGGWRALSRKTWGFAFLIGLAALSLATPWTTIRPAFTHPRLRSPADAAATVQGPEIVYDDVVHLLGITTDKESVVPGGTLAVRACWMALQPMMEDYTVFIHLVGRNNERVGERYTYPGIGRFPTSLWPEGRAFCDLYHVPIEEWTPIPELYDLIVGLYDTSTNEKLAAYTPDGTAMGLPVVNQIRIAPQTPIALPADAHTLEYRLGKRISLVGYQLSNRIQSGQTLTVTLYWRADGDIAENFTAFVQLLDENKQLLAQHDSPPRYGRYPTSAWHVGDIVPDNHVLVEVPTFPADQNIQLVTGMYRPTTMELLPVAGPDGPKPDNLIPLPLKSP